MGGSYKRIKHTVGLIVMKKYIVTGAASGIGHVITEEIIKKGDFVYAIDNNETVVPLFEGVENVSAFVCDLSDKKSLQKVFDEIKAVKGGKVVGALNSASIRTYGALHDSSESDWESLYKVNVIGMVNLVNLALPLLRESGSASVVNLSSCYGVLSRAGLGIYDATKAAQISIMNTYAVEEAESSVRFNTICPGPVLTKYHLERFQQQGMSLEEIQALRSTHTLVRRWGEPLEIAHLALWLLSEQSTFINGEVIMADGGLQHVRGGK